jgi:hypothetical protein
VWLNCPDFTDVLVKGETLQRLQLLSELVGIDEVSEMPLEPLVGSVMEAPDGCFLDRAVHPFDLASIDGLVWSVDVEEHAGILEGVPPEELLLFDHLPDLVRSPSFALRVGKVDAIVSEHGMDLVGNRLDQSFQKGGCRGSAGFLDQLHERKLAGAVDGNIEVQLTFGCLGDPVCTSTMSM